MANIFYKITGDNGLGNNVLVLEPREALVYPFEFGTGWNALSAGCFISFCGTSGGDNSLLTSETSNAFSLKNNNFYFGFTTKENPVPYSQDGVYFGLHNSISAGRVATLQRVGTNSFNADGACLGSLGQSLIRSGLLILDGFSDSFFYGVPFFQATGFTGNNLQSIFLNINFNLNRTTKAVTGTLNVQNQVYYNNVSENLLRKNMLSPHNNPFQTQGFYTNDNTTTGTLLQLPNALFLYNPFFFNKIRIHNIAATVRS